jgi:drug/metabolite transporter (DMT)-like permease
MAGEIIAVSSILCFVISNAMIRKVENVASPIQINAVRTTVGALTFLLVALILGVFTEMFSFSANIWLLLLVSVLLAQVIGDTAYFKAQEMLGTTKALAISMTFPLITFLLSALILHTKIYYWFYISAILIIIGVLLIARSQEQTSKIQEQNLEEKDTTENEGNKEIDNPVNFKNKFKSIIEKPRFKIWFSVAIGLVASISWAFGIVYTDKVLNTISDLLSTGANSSLIGNAARFPFAALVLILFSWRTPKYKIKNWNKKHWGWLLVAALLGTSAGAFLFAEGTRVAGAPLMSLIAASSPLFALPISWIINKEKISIIGLIGVLLTIGGVILVLVL